MTNATSKEPTTSKSPTHLVYQVREGNGAKGFWNRIGAAWAHTDSRGFNVQLTSLPLDGRVTLRIATETKE